MLDVVTSCLKCNWNRRMSLCRLLHGRYRRLQLLQELASSQHQLEHVAICPYELHTLNLQGGRPAIALSRNAMAAAVQLCEEVCTGVLGAAALGWVVLLCQ